MSKDFLTINEIGLGSEIDASVSVGDERIDAADEIIALGRVNLFGDEFKLGPYDEKTDFGDDIVAKFEFAARQIERFQAEARRARDNSRKRVREGLAIVKAAERAGRSVRRATIGGVTLEFGGPETEATAASERNELDEWLSRHPEHVRSPERH